MAPKHPIASVCCPDTRRDGPRAGPSSRSVHGHQKGNGVGIGAAGAGTVNGEARSNRRSTN